MRKSEIQALKRRAKTRRVTTFDCAGCGACCSEMVIPPETVYAEFSTFDHANIPQDDWPRSEWAATPPQEAWDLIVAQINRPEPNQNDNIPCCWLDLKTLQCRFCEHRPDICRDFELGGEACRAWCQTYQIQGQYRG